MYKCTYNLTILTHRTLYTLYVDSATPTIDITPEILKCACLLQSPQLSRLPLFSNMGWNQQPSRNISSSFASGKWIPSFGRRNKIGNFHLTIHSYSFNFHRLLLSKEGGKIEVHLHICSIRHNFVKRGWLRNTGHVGGFVSFCREKFYFA